MHEPSAEVTISASPCAVQTGVGRTPVGPQRTVEVPEGQSPDLGTALVGVLRPRTLVLVIVILSDEDTCRDVDKGNVFPGDVLCLSTATCPAFELRPSSKQTQRRAS